MRTVLEFMVFTAIKTVEQADRIIGRARHPAGAVLVDPLHLRRSGGSPADVAALVALNADRYPYAQFCDGLLATPDGRGPALYAEAVEDRLAPGEGELPLAELLAALPAGAALSVEAPVAAYAHLGAGERAQRLIAATRRLLEG
jgi:sugar phosphate isomerase/epimerase